MVANLKQFYQVCIPFLTVEQTFLGYCAVILPTHDGTVAVSAFVDKDIKGDELVFLNGVFFVPFRGIPG